MRIWKLCVSVSVKPNGWTVCKHVRKTYYASLNALEIINPVLMVSHIWPRFDPFSILVSVWSLSRLSMWRELSQWLPGLFFLFLQPNNNIWVNNNSTIINIIPNAAHRWIIDVGHNSIFDSSDFKTDQLYNRTIYFGTNHRSEHWFDYRDSNGSFNDVDGDYDRF